MRAPAIAYQEAADSHAREHLTLYFDRLPDRFMLNGFTQVNDQSAMRWALQEPTDFVFLQAIYSLPWCARVRHYGTCPRAVT